MGRRATLVDRRIKRISNIHPRPIPQAAGTSTNSLTWRTSASSVATLATVICADGTQGVRQTRVTDAAAALYNGQGVGALWQQDKGNFRAGDTWTVLFNARSNVDVTMTQSFGYGTGSATHGSTSVSFALVAGVLRECRRFITWSQAMIDADGTAFCKWNPGAVGIGNWVEFSKMCVVQGLYLGPFVNADTPGWKSAGVNNSSASYGRPYTLESIVGSSLPIYDVASNTTGTNTRPSEDGTDGLTLYVFGNRLAAADTFTFNFRDGGGTRRLGATSNSTTRQSSFLTTGETSQFGNGIAAKLGGTVLSCSVSPGRTIFSYSTDFVAQEDRAVNPGVFTASVAARGIAGTGVFTFGMIWREYHNAEKQVAVQRWYANRYNYPVVLS